MFCWDNVVGLAGVGCNPVVSNTTMAISPGDKDSSTLEPLKSLVEVRLTKVPSSISRKD